MSISFGPPQTFNRAPACCCAPADCECPCCASGYWTEYTITIAGVVGGPGPCPDVCETARGLALNGTWTLKKDSGCSWKTDEQFSDPCGDLPTIAPYWFLSCQDFGDGTKWWLRSGAGGFPYKAELGDFDCLTGGTLGPTGTADDGCVHYTDPAVAVSPAGVFVPCSPPPPASYNCVANVCVDPGDGTGTYATLLDCQAACPPPVVSYNCVAGACVDPGDGTGVYPTLVACEADCPNLTCPDALTAAADDLTFTTSSADPVVDGLVITVSRTGPTTFSGTGAVPGCIDCDTLTVDVYCDGDTIVVAVVWDGEACAKAGLAPCSDSWVVVTTTPLVITGTKCYETVGSGPCSTPGSFDWILM